MSEKATLLTSIPPVAKSSTTEKTSLLSTSGGASVQSTDGAVSGVEGVAAESGQSITAFQAATYASFVLTFCLAGFAAVVLFRKASKIAEGRFVVGAKSLAAAAGLIALHGFFATYLYANHLNGQGAIPLFVMMALWALVGPLVAVVLNYLLTPKDVPEKGAVVVDACVYFAIFACAAIALLPSVKEDASLLFSLLGGFLFIVPIARSFSAFRKAKARHPELGGTSEQVLIYSLLVLPALLPVVVFAHTCGLSDGVVLFLFNFITFDFLLIAGLSMIASAEEMSPRAAEENKGSAADASAAVADVPSKPAVVEFSAPRQPKSKKLPPRESGKVAAGVAMPAAPRKPGSAAAGGVPGTPKVSAPVRVKAPVKPKKRF